MAGASQDAVVAFPGQKIAFGTVLAARLLAKLGLDKACPRGFAAEPPRQDHQHNQVAADLRRAERGSGATVG